MLRNFLLLLIVTGLTGCGQGQSATTTRSSEKAYQLGREAFDVKDYDAASRYLDQALIQQGLNADLAAEALMMRAKSNIQLGRPQEALRDLVEVDKGPAPRDEVWAAKGDVALLQGDRDEALRLYSKARKLNPAVKFPDKL